MFCRRYLLSISFDLTASWVNCGVKISIMATTYLILYNLAQTAGWAYIMAVGLRTYFQSPSELYSAVETPLQIFQTLAALEVFHALVGLVRSNVFITAFQVASRVFLVWPILAAFDASQSSIGFPMLLLAWTITEIIRYGFYSANLLGIKATPLVFLRYTLFVILYPVGVTGELLCIYVAAARAGETGQWSYPMPNKYNISFSFQLFLFVVMLSYLPIFPQLYLHMFAQRKKVLSPSAKKTE